MKSKKMKSVNIFDQFWKKLLIAIIPLGFAIITIFYSNPAEQKLDNSILFLILLSILVIAFPWERFTSFKAAGIEIELDKHQLGKAIEDIEVIFKTEKIPLSDEKLKKLIGKLTPKIEKINGSRILWIDDSPHNILGERRLLRALGIETIMADSSQKAKDYLDSDGDFDLIISDMRSGQMVDKSKKYLPEAVRFIKEVRNDEIKRKKNERWSHIPYLPVIFYSGKTMSEMWRMTEPIQQKDTETILTRGAEQLIFEVIDTLFNVRSELIQIKIGRTPESEKNTIT